MIKYRDIIKKYDNNKYHYGIHISILPTIYEAINNIIKLKCNCMQIFIANPMSGKISDDKLQYYKKEGNSIINKLLENNIKLFIHSPYIINYARILDNKKISLIKKELIISDYIGAIGIVIHVGKYLKLTKEEGINNMYNNLIAIIDFIRLNKLKSKIILETASGQGTELLVSDGNLNELANFYKKFSKLEKRYIKLCVDTCHIYSAGYDISTKDKVKKLFVELDKKIGIHHIVLIHLNDSKTGLSSRVDRHENLGKGKIAIEGLKEIIRYGKLFNIPLVLETPDRSKRELEIIRKS
jgi:deoxyribonuclease-4